MIFSKQRPLTRANRANGETALYYSGRGASIIFGDFINYFQRVRLFFILFAIPFSSTKLSSRLYKKSHPAADIIVGSGLGVEADLVVPLTR
jgi:hypothetical protein